MEFIPYGLKGQAAVRWCVLVDELGELFATSQSLVQFLTALAQVDQIVGFKHRTQCPVMIRRFNAEIITLGNRERPVEQQILNKMRRHGTNTRTE